MTQEKTQQIIFVSAGIITILGAIAQIADFQYAPYIFALGTLLLVYSHLKNALAANDDNFRMRRLSRIGFISSLLLIIACYLMFVGSNAWVVLLLIYAVVTFFLSFRSE